MERRGQFIRIFVSGIQLVHFNIQFRVHSPHLRSGTCTCIYVVIRIYNTILNCTSHACRTRVIGKLAKEFASPADAKRHYFVSPSCVD